MAYLINQPQAKSLTICPITHYSHLRSLAERLKTINHHWLYVQLLNRDRLFLDGSLRATPNTCKDIIQASECYPYQDLHSTAVIFYIETASDEVGYYRRAI